MKHTTRNYNTLGKAELLFLPSYQKKDIFSSSGLFYKRRLVFVEGSLAILK